MSFTNFGFGLALTAFLLQGALGNPVSTSSSAGVYGATISPSPTCTNTICADYINECGQMYGGCFLDPVCTGGTAWPTFVKPPCPTTTSRVSSSSSACTQSICQDFINECGKEYGGCFLDPKCTGGTTYPTFSKPPCPAVTSNTSSVSSSACAQSICVDYVSSCGQLYGGCFLDPKCTGGSTYPTFTPPPCPSPTSKSSSKSLACTQSICAEYINECGVWYGECFLDPQCTGGSVWPTFTGPPCPASASNSKVYTLSATATCSYSICVDGIDVCGQAWGNCYLAPECGGSKVPSFTTPYCAPTVFPIAIETVTRYTSFPLVTVTSTSTSHYPTPVNSTIPSTNSTRIRTPSPTQSPSAPAFTGSAVRNVAGFGMLAVAAVAGALFL